MKFNQSLKIFQDPTLINDANDFALIKIILQGNTSEVQNGVWDMREMCTTTNVNKWAMVNLDDRSEER